MKGFLLGVGIGLALGVLFAPEAGEVSRRKLKQYAEDALNALTDESSEIDDAELNEPTGAVDRATTTAEAQDREEMLDKTLADSFPSSDPPSTIPDRLPGDRKLPKEQFQKLS